MPARSRIGARALGLLGAIWRTTHTAASRSGGNPCTTCLSASTPPAEAPITTRSRDLAGCSSVRGEVIAGPAYAEAWPPANRACRNGQELVPGPKLTLIYNTHATSRV